MKPKAKPATCQTILRDAINCRVVELSGDVYAFLEGLECVIATAKKTIEVNPLDVFGIKMRAAELVNGVAGIVQATERMRELNSFGYSKKAGGTMSDVGAALLAVAKRKP